ncbi:MAG: tetratricopeptide repeat protein [Elusimicrobia bacterium]|nr:tetratricopeptide repeat protein [Elusimicrobiota bacterium]
MKKFEFVSLIFLILGALAYLFWNASSDIFSSEDYVKAEKKFESGKYSEFLNISENILNSHPKDGKLRYLRALAFREIGDTDKALSEIEKSLDLGYPTVQSLVLKADIMGEEKNDQNSRLILSQKAVSEDPSYDGGYYQKGLAYLSLNENEKALKEFSVVFLQKGELAYDAAIKMSLILIKSGNYEKALEKINFVINKYPQSPDAFYALYLLKRKTGDNIGALNAINYAVFYGAKEYLYEKSMLSEELGDLNSALEDFLAWPGFSDSKKENLYRAAKLAFRCDKNDMALSFISKIFKSHNIECRDFLLKGRILFKKGEIKEAKLYIEEALKDKSCYNEASHILDNIPGKV